jgi:hypothetical protein
MNSFHCGRVQRGAQGFGTEMSTDPTVDMVCMVKT